MVVFPSFLLLGGNARLRPAALRCPPYRPSQRATFRDLENQWEGPVHLPAMTATKLLAMRSMRDFDPARPARVHDLLNDTTLEWNTGWADNWRK